ncbi:hypothetical protein [Anaerocolumna chitinilytica]|uniref:Uncharacterized protein n=1 Tax=Anaerocolumna chitinilytica TaxID=1727145 RepID=A0A7I8DQ50_9FIRM|nr:hypothetical protein [Anaerocolumna chitinilytica]BCK00561.1 hypothetical protein bsdcttw_36010 [Anaerocolumna chitinilytica]
MVLFEKKNERAMNWLKETNQKEVEGLDGEAPFTPESADDIEDKSINAKPKKSSRTHRKNGMEIEKHDMLALTLSALLIFMPIAILILGLFALIAWLFF